ncbi:hypothetical protein E4U53_001562 [Claviceps sorghi]|nr:hypothetical protein E4U53_001562 [Claviceps sorghi]
MNPTNSVVQTRHFRHFPDENDSHATRQSKPCRANSVRGGRGGRMAPLEPAQHANAGSTRAKKRRTSLLQDKTTFPMMPMFQLSTSPATGLGVCHAEDLDGGVDGFRSTARGGGAAHASMRPDHDERKYHQLIAKDNLQNLRWAVRDRRGDGRLWQGGLRQCMFMAGAGHAGSRTRVGRRERHQGRDGCKRSGRQVAANKSRFD